MAVDSLALTNRTCSNITAYIFSNSISDEMMLNLFKHFLSAPMTCTGRVVIDLQKLASDSLLRRNIDTVIAQQ